MNLSQSIRLTFVVFSAWIAPAHAALDTPKPAADSAEVWQKMVDTEHGYEITLPANWQFEQTRQPAPDGGTRVLLGVAPAAARSLEIRVYFGERVIDFDRWGRGYAQQSRVGGATVQEDLRRARLAVAPPLLSRDAGATPVGLSLLSHVATYPTVDAPVDARTQQDVAVDQRSRRSPIQRARRGEWHIGCSCSPVMKNMMALLGIATALLVGCADEPQERTYITDKFPAHFEAVQVVADQARGGAVQVVPDDPQLPPGPGAVERPARRAADPEPGVVAHAFDPHAIPSRR